MMIVPLEAVPAQTVHAILSGQPTQIVLRQRRTGVYLDLYVAEALIIGGVICQINNPIVRSEYLGFAGDLAFIDTQPDGVTDLVSYEGIGTRFFLAHLP